MRGREEEEGEGYKEGEGREEEEEKGYKEREE